MEVAINESRQPAAGTYPDAAVAVLANRRDIVGEQSVLVRIRCEKSPRKAIQSIFVRAYPDRSVAVAKGGSNMLIGYTVLLGIDREPAFAVANHPSLAVKPDIAFGVFAGKLDWRGERETVQLSVMLE